MDWNIGEALETFYQYRSEFSEFQKSLRKSHPSERKNSSNANQQNLKFSVNCDCYLDENKLKDKESILEEMFYVTE